MLFIQKGFTIFSLLFPVLSHLLLRYIPAPYEACAFLLDPNIRRCPCTIYTKCTCSAPVIIFPWVYIKVNVTGACHHPPPSLQMGLQVEIDSAVATAPTAGSPQAQETGGQLGEHDMRVIISKLCKFGQYMRLHFVYVWTSDILSATIHALSQPRVLWSWPWNLSVVVHIPQCRL